MLPPVKARQEGWRTSAALPSATTTPWVVQAATSMWPATLPVWLTMRSWGNWSNKAAVMAVNPASYALAGLRGGLYAAWTACPGADGWL